MKDDESWLEPCLDVINLIVLYHNEKFLIGRYGYHGRKSVYSKEMEEAHCGLSEVTEELKIAVQKSLLAMAKGSLLRF